MKLTLTASITALFLTLGGCTTMVQQPLTMSPAAITASGGKIGIAIATPAKANTYFPGASCLLCYAAASAANSSLSTHAATLSTEDLGELRQRVADLIKAKGGTPVVITDAIDFAKLPKNQVKGPNVSNKDYSALKQKFGIDKLVMLQVDTVGFTRSYSSYIPTSKPQAKLTASGFMVDLNTSLYTWFAPISIEKGVDGNWDEPPAFPGLTNAYYQVIEMSKDEFAKPFSN